MFVAAASRVPLSSGDRAEFLTEIGVYGCDRSRAAPRPRPADVGPGKARPMTRTTRYSRLALVALAGTVLHHRLRHAGQRRGERVRAGQHRDRRAG